jgi:hypothetical protein
MRLVCAGPLLLYVIKVRRYKYNIEVLPDRNSRGKEVRRTNARELRRTAGGEAAYKIYISHSTPAVPNVRLKYFKAVRLDAFH